MRAHTAFAITALLAALNVARGMEFDLVDRYARAAARRARPRPPAPHRRSTSSGLFPRRAEIRAAFH